MTVEQMRTVFSATPFTPFIMNLADGREIPVIGRDFLMFSPSGRTVVVYQADESMNIIDLLLVTDLEVRPKLVAANISKN